jgi:soluble lytic murein transglycosylase-like protein
MILRLATVPSDRLYDLAWSVARWSRNFGVRPEVVVGVLYVESRFDPAARNGIYHGLGQLSPTIRAAWHAGDGYDLASNVRATCAHLAGLVRAYGEREGLSAYNGGPGGRHLAECRGYAARVLRIANGGTT